MTNMKKLATVSVLALLVAAPAFAQSEITGVRDLNDRIDDITDDVNDDLAEGDDADRFGPNGVAWVVERSSVAAKSIQSGYLYTYALIMLLGLIAAVTYVLL